MRNFLILCRVVAGFVFLFSGIVKGVDPYGSMFKLIDYFTAFGLETLNDLALILGMLLAMTEAIVGFAIITGVRLREASWGLLIFMMLFTPLTLVLALTNPVSDCGCFGDAIQLTNWQTFLKNIFLLLFVIPLFIYRRRSVSTTKASIEWIVVVVAAAIFLLFSYYNYRHLPVVDFRPYHTGVNIYEDMTIPDGSPVDEYEIKLIYEKDGVRKDFDLSNYPSEDSSWIFIDQKSTLIKEGYQPPIHDFILSSPYGDDITYSILTNPGITLLMISRVLSEADREFIDKGIKIGKTVSDEGIDFYLATSSSGDEVMMLSRDINYLFGDETMLKTVIRANPGYIVISDGTIVAKWAGIDLPAEEEIVDEIIKGTENIGYNPTLRVVIIMVIALIISLLSSQIIKFNKFKK
jgi:uncharacterized membrane protein YphA (DoxX/SURF4 family)